MSWLDDVPVGNDDQDPFDPNQPIEREFVLAPAWRAFKAKLSTIFKRSSAERAGEYSPVAATQPLTSRTSEPVPQPPSQIDEPELTSPASKFQPVLEELRSPESEPVALAPFEPEPALQQLQAEPEPLESAPVAFEEVIPESQLEPVRSEQPSRIHMQPEIQTEIEGKAIAASALPSVEAPSIPSVAHATSATVLANARGESKLVAAAVALESWGDSVKTRITTWRASLKQRRASAQQELFAVPSSNRDRVWMQTTVAAAAIALAFLMGWIAANSRRPASSVSEEAITGPTESPATSTRGVTVSPALAKSSGVTVQAGGATVQAGGVTLSPSSSVSAAIPATETVASKPSPARPTSRRARSTPPGHLRRSIDSADDEVVVHHYTPKPSPIVSAQKQTAQVKQYSDIN